MEAKMMKWGRAVEKEKPKKKSKYAWMKWGAVAVCLCMLIGVAIFALMNQNHSGEKSEEHNGFDSTLLGVLIRLTEDEKE